MRCGLLRMGVLGMLLMTGLIPSLRGCGIGWRVPVTHFAGVDERGYVCYSQKIEDVDLGEGLKLPLIVNFRSDREASSPYLGKGWILALFDSRFVQTSENAFQMIQPDGWIRPFYRRNSNDSVLDGGADWKAEIKDSTITAKAGCGWKLVYVRGKLVSLTTPKSRTFEVIYSSGYATELREKGSAKFSVDFDRSNGHAKALSFNGKRIEIVLDKRPRVAVISGQSVVGGLDASLRHLSGVFETSDTDFEFSVDAKIRPTLKISQGGGEGRLIVWNPATKCIASDRDWNYNIAPAENMAECAAIYRQNGGGQSEFWHHDDRRGEERTLSIDGVTVIRQWFVGGAMAGKPRKIEVLQGEKQMSLHSYSYDQDGFLIREQFNELQKFYEKNRLVKILQSGTPILDLRYITQ